MMSYKLIAVLLVMTLVSLTSSVLKMNELKTTELSKDFKESKNYEEAINQLIEARGNFLRIYGRYPVSIAELSTQGLISSSFSNSEYGKDLTLNSDGSITVTTREIGNDLKNLYLISNQENLKTIKNVSNTETLVEQQKRFNALKSNEKSITIGNSPSLSKSSSNYTAPSLQSSSDIDSSNLDMSATNSQKNLKGW